MKRQWIDSCLEMSLIPADFSAGARKIIRNRQMRLTRIRQDLTIADSGYTKSKLSMLRKLYLHEESLDASVSLWERRLGQRSYGSVGFHCFNHTVKNNPDKKSKRASVMGPCIQSVSITYNPNHTASIDLFYRTTELFKKFPADLVFLRDEIFSRFDFEACPVSDWTFHFANVTLHPMYFVTIIPHLDDPVAELEEIRKVDPYFWTWVVKWTARYFIPEYHRGIQKFSQAMRVHKDAHERIPPEIVEVLVPYLEENHPGMRNEYKELEDDEL